MHIQTRRRYTHVLCLCIVLLSSACTSIINSITDTPLQPNPSTTTVGTDIDDWQMNTLVGVNIKKAAPQLANAHINVNTYNKVILLTGEVPSAALRTLAGSTTRNYPGVRQVYNELQIKGSSGILARANDSWLTGKIKTKLLFSDGIRSGTVNIITESGVVYLMGMIKHAEADKIATIASRTGGVFKVIRVFEYLD